jgi:hypothetical protein
MGTLPAANRPLTRFDSGTHLHSWLTRLEAFCLIQFPPYPNIAAERLTAGGGKVFKTYQWCELIGILLVLAATATQLFYMEPLRRQIEYRINAFTQQQNGQILADAIYQNRIVLLSQMKAEDSQVERAKAERDKLIHRFKTADANVANVVMNKENIEEILQIVVVTLFALGTLLTAIGRAAEMRALNKKDQI